MFFIMSSCNTQERQSVTAFREREHFTLEHVTVIKHRQLMQIIKPEDYNVSPQKLQDSNYFVYKNTTWLSSSFKCDIIDVKSFRSCSANDIVYEFYMVC